MSVGGMCMCMSVCYVYVGKCRVCVMVYAAMHVCVWNRESDLDPQSSSYQKA